MVVAAYSANGSTNPDEALIRVTNNTPLAVFRAYLAAINSAGLPRRQALPPKDSAGWTVRTVYFDDGTESGERGGTAQLFTRSNQAYIRIYMYAG